MTLAEICEPVQKGLMPLYYPRIFARCQSEEQKRGIEDAARLLGLTTSSFILTHMLKAAASVLREHGRPVPFLDAKQEGQDEATPASPKRRE